MGDTRFKLLFTPLDLGPITIPNRIVSSGHDTVMVDHGAVTDQLVAYHKARAEGGTGLIIVQVAGVHHTARYTSHVLMATDDSCIEGYARLVEAVKPHGTRIFGQLFHPGREIMESDDGTAPVAVAPSAVPNERFRVMPRALERGQIEEIVEGYGAAAARLAAAGMDGVEVVASHGYLPAQFLNPRVNLREDGYGGSPEARRRFLVEAVRAARRGAGPGQAVGLRVSLDEREPDGLPSNEMMAAVQALVEEGLIDYLNVTTGTSATLAGSDHIAPDMSFANGYLAPDSAKARHATEVPVIVAGRINQPQEAERILAAGEADAVVMTRALICDPTMPGLARSGREEEIRACIGCNQACIGHFHAGYPISCIQHPETGRELRFGRVAKSRVSRRVLVVGGGPAGMKAAAIAAERGHRVRLVEASGHLGGQVLLAQRIPGREEFGGAADNLSREVRRHRVEVVLHRRLDPDGVMGEAADRVIVATGAVPYEPPLEVLGNPWRANAWEVISGQRIPPRGSRVVVLDWRGDWIGMGVARLLAEAGCGVTLAVRGYGPGESLQQYVRDQALAQLVTRRVEILPLVRPYGADDDTLYLQHVLTDEPVILEHVDALVTACGHRSRDDLLAALRAAGVEATGVGDCLAPRTVEEAVLEGLVAGAEA